MKSDNLTDYTYRAVCPACGTYLIIQIEVSGDESTPTDKEAAPASKESTPSDKVTNSIVCSCPRCRNNFTVVLTALEKLTTVYR